MWGYSSAGRAPEWHSGGQRFEPDNLDAARMLAEGNAKNPEELLRLCEGDNLGIRYALMHLYAYFENEDGALALHKKYDEYEESQMLFPLAVLYYKKADFEASLQYLRRLAKANKDTKKFLRMMGMIRNLSGVR